MKAICTNCTHKIRREGSKLCPECYNKMTEEEKENQKFDRETRKGRNQNMIKEYI